MMKTMDLSESEFFDDFTEVNLGYNCNFELFDEETVNKVNDEGWTRLMYACYRGSLDVVKALKAKGAKLKSGPSDATLMRLAIASGDVQILQEVYLREEIEFADQRGWTSLFYAVFYGRDDCIRFLLQQGASVYALDAFGQTPINLALKSGMENIVTLLRGSSETNTDKRLSSPAAQPLGRAGSGKQTEPSPTTPSKRLNRINDILFKPKRTYTPSKKNHLSDKENTPRKWGAPGKVETPSRVLPMSPAGRCSPIGPWFAQPQSGPHLTPKMLMPVLPMPQPTKSSPTVEAFLADLGLTKYWPIFRDEEVDFETFLTFQDENLKEIGISLYGPRRKIALAIEEYRAIQGNQSSLLRSPLWLQPRKHQN